MKKTVKMISTLILTVMLVTSIAGVALAADVNGVLNGLTGDSKTVQTKDLTNVGNNIVTIIQVVGIVIAVIILLIIGIKYMIGSASEKAEYKKTMIPYIVGALLIFAGTSLVRVIYSLSSSVAGNTTK